MSNYEHQIPNDPHTIFYIASLNKQFTAAAILKLVEQNKMSLEDRLSNYFENYEVGKSITIHQLLTNTSGIPSYTEFPDFIQHMSLNRSLDDVVNSFIHKPLSFEPGTQYEYSNSGYFLLGMIIETVSGKPYDNYLSDTFFEPLNMTHSGLDQGDMVIKNKADGYVIDHGILKKSQHFNMSNAYSAGGLYATVGDLYIWNRALFSNTLFNKELLDKMLRPIKNNYGYGLMTYSINDNKIAIHDGNLPGFKSWMQYNMTDHTTIIMLSNFGSGESLHPESQEIEKLLNE